MIFSLAREVYMGSYRRTRSNFFVTLVLAVLAASGLWGCGSDEGTRGLQPSNESAVPASNAEDAMSETARQKQQATDTQRAEVEEFDEAEDH